MFLELMPPACLIILALQRLPTTWPELFYWLMSFYSPVEFYLSSLDSSSISCTCCLVTFSELWRLPFSPSRVCSSSRSMKVTWNTQSHLSFVVEVCFMTGPVGFYWRSNSHSSLKEKLEDYLNSQIRPLNISLSRVIKNQDSEPSPLDHSTPALGNS